MAEPLGLRERKKIDTRRAILKCANTLFHERGFAATRLEDIARRASVHKQTVLRYFGSKEQIALAFRQRGLEKFTRGLLDPARSVSVVEYWRQFIEASATEVAGRGDILRYSKLIETEPSLVVASFAINIQYEDLLSAAFSAEAGLDPDRDLDSRLLAVLLVNGNFNLVRLLVKRGDLHDYVPLALYIVDAAVQRFPVRNL